MRMTFFFCVLFGRGMSRERRKEGRKEGKKERRKEGRNERKKEGTKRGDTPPFYNETRSVFFRFLYISYLVILLLYICFDVKLNYTLPWAFSRRALLYSALPCST